MESKRRWLDKHVETMVLRFVVADQQQQHQYLRDHVAAASRPQQALVQCMRQGV